MDSALGVHDQGDAVFALGTGAPVADHTMRPGLWLQACISAYNGCTIDPPVSSIVLGGS